MFDRSTPAENIYELVNYLQENKKPEHYFRGQVSYYERNAPSGSRPSLNNKIEDNYWNLLHTDPFRKRPDQQKAKTSLQTFMLTVFGKVLGNVLCQQYGVTSDAFDITLDPIIAAFFATRKYPTYDHYSFEENFKTPPPLGVIYRVSFHQDQPEMQVVEKTMNILRYMAEGIEPIQFTNIDYIMTKILYQKIDLNKPVEDYIREKIEGEPAFLNLIRPTVYISYDTIKKMFIEKTRDLKFSGDMADAFERSRISSQQAGILYPAYRHQAYTSKFIGSKRDMNGVLVADPNLAISLGADAVFEFNLNHRIEAFYFKHNKNCKVEIDSLDILWPNQDVDPIFALIVESAKNHCSKYLADYSVDVLDPKMGLIDRGYYPRMV